MQVPEKPPFAGNLTTNLDHGHAQAESSWREQQELLSTAVEVGGCCVEDWHGMTSQVMTSLKVQSQSQSPILWNAQRTLYSVLEIGM